jgi:hypothetical protein
LGFVNLHFPSENDERITPAGPMQRQICAIKIRHGSLKYRQHGCNAPELSMSLYPLVAVNHNDVMDIPTRADLLNDEAYWMPLKSGHADQPSGVAPEGKIAAPEVATCMAAVSWI